MNTLAQVRQLTALINTPQKKILVGIAAFCLFGAIGSLLPPPPPPVDPPLPSPSANMYNPEHLQRYATELRSLDSTGAVLVSVNADSRNMAEVTVGDAWHTQPKYVRLQMAENLWQSWVEITSPQSPDSAYLKLVDVNGDKVGGSGIAGSLVSVQD